MDTNNENGLGNEVASHRDGKVAPLHARRYQNVEELDIKQPHIQPPQRRTIRSQKYIMPETCTSKHNRRRCGEEKVYDQAGKQGVSALVEQVELGKAKKVR
jgi:hypothetical protein